MPFVRFCGKSKLFDADVDLDKHHSTYCQKGKFD
jgi:hypothetical protein